jgi:hypothetical protein
MPVWRAKLGMAWLSAAQNSVPQNIAAASTKTLWVHERMWFSS